MMSDEMRVSVVGKEERCGESLACSQHSAARTRFAGFHHQPESDSDEHSLGINRGIAMKERSNTEEHTVSHLDESPKDAQILSFWQVVRSSHLDLDTRADKVHFARLVHV